MRKLISFVALFLCAAALQAETINASDLDFGTVSIKGQSYVMGTADIDVSWTGFAADGRYLCLEITDGEDNFYIDDNDNLNNSYCYSMGYAGKMTTSATFSIGFYAEAAGTFTGKLYFYAYGGGDWGTLIEKEVNLKVEVTSDAIVDKVIDFERLNSTSDLKDGDVIVFVSESAGAVSGPLYTTYLQSVTENVTIDKAQGKAKVPETAQMFTLSKYSGNWQFTTTDTKQRLHLDITGKGAFTYADTEPNEILANWGISISGGVAEVSKPDGTFPVEFNGDRFKPYKNSSGTAIALYKKVGDAEELVSKLTIPAGIVFGDVEQDMTKELQVSFVKENIDGEILWDITGADKALFSVDDSDAENGNLLITYLGTAGKTGSVSASLYAYFINQQLDDQEELFPISINLLPATIKLTKLEFSGAPTTIDQGQSIDMSKYIVYTPSNAEDKSLTWTTDHDYQGVVDENGVLTAKHVTGTITVTATSTKVPSVSASHTLTITEPVITDFTLSDSEITLNVGGTKTISVVSFVPDYASATASFSSADKTVATVSTKGVITAKGLGDVNITVTAGSVSKVCVVHVVAVDVNSISFAASEMNLTLGSSLQLNLIVDPVQALDEYTITWNSGNPSVASVNDEGLVSSVAAGDAVISATLAGLNASITIHVVEAQTFAKLTDPSVLAEKDTIILANASVPVVAGKRDNKKLTVLLSDITVTDSEAYADDACRFVLGTEKNQDGFTLTIVGGKTIAVTSSGNDIVDANTKNCKFWEFVADGSNGYFVRNLGNTNAMFKYHSGNAAIKPYKAGTTGAIYVYAYFRKYVEPKPTAVENVEQDNAARKIFRNGQIIIIRNGVEYSIDGKVL